ncbi:putative virulence factor [Vreelandella neptunia]|uniref:Virulence factor n=1 Tax=Vreelandella neptunia TaxID=115551 RepID=A0ABS9S950_9GAMM|nr:virulence factor SrfC family protein [Halomonas neptunia]MCH4812633.1 putative virulence factor [Halomonas neptunia]
MNQLKPEQVTPEQQRLSKGWQAFHEGAGAALEWIAEVRDSAPSLDSEADNLGLSLYRSRNLAQSLSHAATTPMTVGFFGLSQAGKSYLISALAAGENGKLETCYGEARLDFIEHVNPVGGGKEATGLVTRFSRASNSGPREFPVELKLFNEVEVAKVLANAWFNDFDHEREDVYEIDEGKVANLLAPHEGELGKELQLGVTPENVVELWDYLQASFPKSVSKLNARYWPQVVRLAPRLSSHQRADLFSILWGEQPELTNLYRQLAQTLGSLAHASRVYAPLRCLVARDGDGFSQRDSIMNVDILERLGTAQDLPLDVCPAHGDTLGAPVNLPVAQLAALTAELTFPLVEPTRDPRVEKVDLLDFPGYRGRLSLRQIGEAGSQEGLSQLLLRGKVAYLFERYTDSQQMNGLVVCTSSDKQSDVTSVGPVLTRWIEKTQGGTATERGQRDPGLIWALTMFDKRISGALQQTESQLREGWEGLVKMTMLERFGSFEWMQEWAPGQAFDNTFLVRKPRLPVPFLVSEEGREVAIDEGAREALANMQSTFIASHTVQQHVDQPADAWDAMLALDDGGMARIGDYLGRIAGLEYKLDRIEGQLEETYRALITDRLATWHFSDTGGEVAQKRDVANRFWKELQTRLPSLGELQHNLELSDEIVRDLYLSDSEDSSSLKAEGDEDVTIDDGGLYGSSGSGLESGFGELPFGDTQSEALEAPSVASQAPVLQSADHRFARAIYNAWVGHVRELPQRQGLLRMLGLDRELVKLLADELITGASRLKVQEKLQAALLQRGQSGARRDRLVARQALAAQLVLRDFIAWLGFHYVPIEKRPNSFVGAKTHLFGYERHPIAKGALPLLPEQPVDQAKVYLGDWLSGLCLMTQENAGHSGGREITIEQNERLGEVLELFSAKEKAHA